MTKPKDPTTAVVVALDAARTRTVTGANLSWHIDEHTRALDVVDILADGRRHRVASFAIWESVTVSQEAG